MPIQPPSKIPINEPNPIAGRISWHIENTLVRFAKKVFNAIVDSTMELISRGLGLFLEETETEMADNTNPIISAFLNNPEIPNETRKMFQSALAGSHQSDAFTDFMVMVATVLSLGQPYFAPFGRLMTYHQENTLRTHRPSPEQIALMQRTGLIDSGEIARQYKDIGVSDHLWEAYQKLTENWLNFGQLGQATLRGLMSESELKTLMKERSVPDNQADLFTELLQLIPGPSDLIRMAVREAWNDNVARTFGYDDDYPSEFGEWTEKIGLSADWARKFWRAHWELPGVREGFEMLHRRIIDDSDLELLLRSRDIPSFWRKNLVQLSYNPYTRVDVRRMYSMGVVSVEEVFDTYQDLGYDENHASKLTEWTVKQYGESNRDLTKGDIIASYTNSTITYDETFELLTALGYDDWEIDILTARAEIKKQDAYETEYIEEVRLSYVGHKIDKNDVIAKLNQLNPPSGFVTERIEIWDLQKAQQTRKLTQGNIKDMFGLGIITSDEAKQELVKLDYEDYAIEWLLQLWSMKLILSEEE